MSLLKKVLWVAAVMAAVTGCSQWRHHAGAGAEGDHNVLTGGPVTGTTIRDLPQAVKQTLKQRVPTAEIADITRQNRNERTVYKISFLEPGKNPTLYIAEDGSVVEGGDKAQ